MAETTANEDSNLTEPTVGSSSSQNGTDGRLDAIESAESSSESEIPVTRELRSAKRQAIVATEDVVVKRKRVELVSVDHVDCLIDCLANNRKWIRRITRSGRSKFNVYNAWKNKWVQDSRCAPSLRLFVLDELLPFWISCNRCNKFRKCSADENQWNEETIAGFTCDQLYNREDACEEPENKKVNVARDLSWIQTASAPTFLHNSPALYYLKEEYFCDELGMSPTRSASAKTPDAKAATFMIPFNIPNGASIAFCVRPDGLEYDELEAFPEFSNEPVPYFAMRNLCVALWTLNPFEYLAFEKCLAHLICRGLARVWYATQLQRVYDFLCLKNIINYGVVPFPARKILKERVRKHTLEVVVVGAGISGLTAARQLTLNGAKVTVLEATERCGGRMKDDHSLKVAVGCGAQLVTGVINSPLILMCHQVGLNYRKLTDECPLVDASCGRVISPSADRVVDEHFNCVLDAINQWRKITKGTDSSLLEKINTFHKKFTESLDFPWSENYERILQWQIGNVEFSCGSRLSDVSCRNWDQNEAIGQFAGDHAILCDGSSKIIQNLAEDLDIRFKHVVERVDYGSKRKPVVYCKNGKKFYCDKILMCIPLAMYHKETKIPEPVGHVVTHWGRDPNIGMSYSYVKVGASGDHYDLMAEPVQNRIYFAGEATSRWFPQTMTGAYLYERQPSSIVTVKITMLKLKCKVQNYEWGKKGTESTVARLNGEVIDENKAYAELWMGVHPNGMASLEAEQTTLEEYIKQHPEVLALHEDGTLQFLFKILSVGKALSVQVHPTNAQARILHQKDPKNYPDPRHKPEIAIALTNFELLCGFRQPKDLLWHIKEAQKKTLSLIFSSIWKSPQEKIASAIGDLVKRLQDVKEKTDLHSLILRLNSQYPGGDVGVLAPIFLNYFSLKEGESTFLGPNEPHAYLFGGHSTIKLLTSNYSSANNLPSTHSSAILIVIVGKVDLTADSGQKQQLKAGDIVFIPATVKSIQVSNPTDDFCCYRAFTPLPH
ncbi:Amine oxidase [Aphelenchoides besseyi]|nr:Amine oxidase [Aphelenchoides besseyi]